MQREILFRGKRVDNGEWVEGYFIPTFENKPGIGLKSGYVSEVLPETVGQFTGITDKNGRKIFEGDKVESWAGLSTSASYMREVVWSDCGLIFEPQTGFILCKRNEHLFEITGTIHD